MMMISQYQYCSCSCVLETANARTRISMQEMCEEHPVWERRSLGRGGGCWTEALRLPCRSKESRARWSAVLEPQSPRCVWALQLRNGPTWCLCLPKNRWQETACGQLVLYWNARLHCPVHQLGPVISHIPSYPRSEAHSHAFSILQN